MKPYLLSFLILICFISHAQPERIKTIFPEGTVFHQGINYAGDTLRRHTLDIFLPSHAKPNTPAIIWIHGGGWREGTKYNDMSYMKNTLRSFLDQGFALVTIEYRLSTDAVFPAPIRDCYQALNFIHTNAAQYQLDNTRFSLIGFSAGGHLASLLALSLNNDATDFHPEKKKPLFKIKAVMDFYGPSDLLLFFSHAKPEDTNSITQLLGVSPLVRPDISKQASPVTYVDAGDPPFFIVQGEKDPDVQPAQSYLLKATLDNAKVKNELTIVKDAPHYGAMFDTDDIRIRLLAFLATAMK